MFLVVSTSSGLLRCISSIDTSTLSLDVPTVFILYNRTGASCLFDISYQVLQGEVVVLFV